MSTSKLINYTTRDFLSENELELYISKQDEIYTPGVIEEFKKSGLLRRVVTKIWNKEGVARLGIIFEYEDDKAFLACQKISTTRRWLRILLIKYMPTGESFYTNFLLRILIKICIKTQTEKYLCVFTA